MKQRFLLLLVLMLTTITTAWADWSGATYTATANETINATINVSADATLTINSGVTVTVNGGIVVADGKTLIITGSGTLKVTGSNGTNGGNGANAIVGIVIIYGANVQATGGNGGNGSTGGQGSNGANNYYIGGNGSPGGAGSTGGIGGAAFSGQITIYSGTIKATGGQGGTGGKGGTGGNGGNGDLQDGGRAGNGGTGGIGGTGGNAFSGTINIYGGTITAKGGTGGQGGTGGTGGNGGDGGTGEPIGGDGGNGGQGGNGGNGGYAFAATVTFHGGNVNAGGGNSGNSGQGGTGGFGGHGRDSGASGNTGASGSNGNPGNAFNNDVTFSAAEYTLKGGASANPSETVSIATGYRYVTITAVNAPIPVVASGNCGTSGHESEVTWSLNILGEMTISGTGEMDNSYSDFGQPWADKRDMIKSIVIENGVITIGNRAFRQCSNLTSVTIPNSVIFIGDVAFYDCSSLTSVTLNSNPFISASAFTEGATVTMNLAVNKAAEGEFWTTFYNLNQNFQVPAEGTKVFKAALTGSALALTELTTDKIVTKDKPVILKSTASPIVLTLTTTDSNNDFTGNSLQGVPFAAGLTADGTHFVLNKTAEKGVGFYRMTSGNTIGVGKAYLTYNGTLAPDFLRFEEEENSATDFNNSSPKVGEVPEGQRSMKLMIDGKLYILCDGITYDALGKRIK